MGNEENNCQTWFLKLDVAFESLSQWLNGRGPITWKCMFESHILPNNCLENIYAFEDRENESLQVPFMSTLYYRDYLFFQKKHYFALVRNRIQKSLSESTVGSTYTTKRNKSKTI